MAPLEADDAKLVTLARGAMARAEALSGAAVRDRDGRTYAGAPVGLRSLRLSALQVAVVGALASGAGEFETAVLVGGADDDPGLAALAEASPSAAVIRTDRRGEPLDA